jgi:hypothetical protein
LLTFAALEHPRGVHEIFDVDRFIVVGYPGFEDSVDGTVIGALEGGDG